MPVPKMAPSSRMIARANSSGAHDILTPQRMPHPQDLLHALFSAVSHCADRMPT
jgi:hypothetical protein